MDTVGIVVESLDAAIPNLFCERTSRGRYQVIFYSDCVLVWPLSRGPDGPPISYAWGPEAAMLTKS
jgi:hypothetical protein